MDNTYLWLQMVEWAHVGVPVHRYAKKVGATPHIYTSLRYEDEGADGESKAWPNAHVRPLMGYIHANPWYNIAEEYGSYRTDDEGRFSDICRSAIGYHSKATVVSPIELAAEAVAELLPAWEMGDATQELIRRRACHLASAPWLYFLGYLHKHEATSILLVKNDIHVVRGVVSEGDGVGEFGAYAASVPGLKDCLMGK